MIKRKYLNSVTAREPVLACSLPVKFSNIQELPSLKAVSREKVRSLKLLYRKVNSGRHNQDRGFYPAFFIIILVQSVLIAGETGEKTNVFSLSGEILSLPIFLYFGKAMRV